ncbi:MAG: chromosomal replication initiator protein DnaA [Clostridia bacterium]|nr:chromosomal replication initiator protein DnaA [Clostridia bacterium]
MKNEKKIWGEVLEKMKESTTPVVFKTWIQPLSIFKIDELVKIIYLHMENYNDFIADVVKNRYIPMLENAFKQVLNQPYSVVLKADDMVEPEKQEVKKPVKVKRENSNIFNPNYNFDNFVVGDCNRFAHAAALAVAESPSEAYNPLFIYGGSGLGKTHLMHAIGIYMLEQNPDANILYISSEMFINEFIKALTENKMGLFKKKYREVDVLLIDDIQFLEGKDKIQEEFFHTFNTLYELNKQIIISSDRAPGKLVNLEERLRSRFMWNLIADIQPADYETRVAILMKKAENEGIEVNEDVYDVICLIAEKVKNNIRELEGAFQRIVSFSALLGDKIDKNFAKKTLKDIFINSTDIITPEKIKKVVCKKFDIKVLDMDSKNKSNNIAYPRQIAMYICREMTDYSLPKIGEIFGGRHYTTVMHACEKIQKEVLKNEELKALIEDIKMEINE